MPKRHGLKYMMMRLTACLLLPAAGGLLLAPVLAMAGLPTVSGIMVTDLTTRSFAVVWESSEPASGSLQLFREDCSTPIPNPNVTAEQSSRTGIIRVTVAELDANSSYCFKTESTSLSSSELTVFPPQPLTVKTQSSVVRSRVSDSGAIIPLANDILRVPAPHSPGLPKNADGILALLRLESSLPHLPLSLLLTPDETGQYFDMNNLFDPTTAASLNLSGGERLRITERHGLLGCRLDRFRTAPADQESTRESDFSACAALDIDCSGAVTVLDILRTAQGNGTHQAAPCFNSDLDVNADGSIDQLDIEAVIGGFNATTF